MSACHKYEISYKYYHKYFIQFDVFLFIEIIMLMSRQCVDWVRSFVWKGKKRVVKEGFFLEKYSNAYHILHS